MNCPSTPRFQTPARNATAQPAARNRKRRHPGQRRLQPQPGEQAPPPADHEGVGRPAGRPPPGSRLPPDTTSAAPTGATVVSSRLWTAPRPRPAGAGVHRPVAFAPPSCGLSDHQAADPVAGVGGRSERRRRSARRSSRRCGRRVSNSSSRSVEIKDGGDTCLRRLADSLARRANVLDVRGRRSACCGSPRAPVRRSSRARSTLLDVAAGKPPDRRVDAGGAHVEPVDQVTGVAADRTRALDGPRRQNGASPICLSTRLVATGKAPIVPVRMSVRR